MGETSNNDMVEGLKILEERWGQLRLSKEEQVRLTMDEEELTDQDTIKERRSLVEKICTERSIIRDAIQSTMGKIWKLGKAATFKEVEKNLFIVTFSTEAEKERVSSGKPWLFDNNLFTLQPLDGRK